MRRRRVLLLLVGGVLAGCGAAPATSTALTTTPAPLPPTALDVEPLWTRPGGSGTIETLAWRPGQAQFASGSSAGQVRIWSADGAAVQNAKFGDFVSGLAWSPDGARLAVATTDGHVGFWPDRGGWPAQIPTTAHRFTAVAFAPNGVLAVALGEASIRLWTDPATAGPTLPVNGQTTALVWSPDGALLAAGNRAGTVAAWSAAGKQRWTAPAANHKDVNALAWSPDGQTLAAGYEDGSVQFLRAADGTAAGTLAAGQAVNAVAWSPNGAVLAVATLAFAVTLWAATERTGLAQEEVGYDVNDVIWSPAGDRLYAAADDHAIHAWTVAPAQGPGPRPAPPAGYMAR